MAKQPASPHIDPYRGRKIGKYEIVTRLSVGGMAELFLAFTSGPGGFRKFVALKQILPDVKTDEFVKMFLDEARITAAFSHPNIGQVFDLGFEDDELYLAMEFLPGQNLEQVMIASSYVRPLPVGFAARVARDICLGLHYAHNFTATSGRKVAVVHRDMAPRNVMITYDGVVKVIDFGIAKARGRIARTHVGMVKGTSGYMSPEQVRGLDLDGRSDLFTAGVLLHEMLCGQRLFDTTDEDAMMRQIANADVAPPRQSNPDIPEALDAVVRRALERDVSKRFATGREMAKAIEAAMGPEIYDEESVAELMQGLFAEKRLKTLALLDNASQGDERISRVIEALRDEKTLSGAEGLTGPDMVPTVPSKAQSFPEQAPAPAAPRSGSHGARNASAPRKHSTSSEQPAMPARARPFPAPSRPLVESPSRRPMADMEEDAPTQIGPSPGLPPESPPEPEPRESRRPPKMGVFTLGPSQPQATSDSRPQVEDSELSEVSEVSRVSRVSMALRGLNRPSRGGLWVVFGIMLVGLAVLFMPESLRSRLGAVFSSLGQATPEPHAVPGPPVPVPTPASGQPATDAYEPPPPAEDSGAQKPVEQAAPPTPPVEPVRPKKPTPATPRPAKKPAEEAVPPEETSEETPEENSEEAPEEAPKETPKETPKSPGPSKPKPAKPPAVEAKPPPAVETPDPSEPSVGPAEVDPDIQPLELTPPSSSEGQKSPTP